MRGGCGWLAAALAPLAGCGYVGDIHPPALGIPMAVQDLSAVQRGATLRLAFTPPALTLDQIPISAPGEIDLRIGPPSQGAFDADAWASGALRVPAEQPEAYAPVAQFAGREIVAAVRTAGPKGRWSPWSNIVAIRIVEPLDTPSQLSAASDAAGVRLEWRHQGPPGTYYRVLRKAEKEEQFTILAARAANPYIDATAAYGSIYRYQVQAAVAVDAREAESDLSSVAEITAIDTFAPAVPAGLNAIAGIGSIELAWDRNTETDFRGYHVYRAESAGGFSRIGELTEAPAFSDRSAQPGKTYRYAVTSVDQKGNESNHSEPVSITAPQ